MNDPDVREFIEKCIAKLPDRLSAKELLMDPFLQSDEDCLCRSLWSQSINAGVTFSFFSNEMYVFDF